MSTWCPPPNAITPVTCSCGGGGDGGSPGEIQVCSAAAEIIRLCDITDTECVPFLRHLLHNCDGTVTAYADTTIDGTTPYTPQGVVGDCDDCPCTQDEQKVLTLCDCLPDGGSQQFLRHLTIDCQTGAITSQVDTELDGTTPYTPVGRVVENCSGCVDCTPTPMCARLSGISGPDQWVMPEGVESLNISIVCGPVTITDCSGEVTVLNEACGHLSWSAPPTDCEPGVLCSPFTIDVPENSAVYVNWTEPCQTGGESP